MEDNGLGKDLGRMWLGSGVSTRHDETRSPGNITPTLRTIVGLRSSSKALESRFLLRELVISRLESWFSEVAEVGVKIPD